MNEWKLRYTCMSVLPSGKWRNRVYPQQISWWYEAGRSSGHTRWLYYHSVRHGSLILWLRLRGECCQFLMKAGLDFHGITKNNPLKFIVEYLKLERAHNNHSPDIYWTLPARGHDHCLGETAPVLKNPLVKKLPLISKLTSTVAA